MRRYACGAGHKWRTLEQLEMVYDKVYVRTGRECVKKVAI